MGGLFKRFPFEGERTQSSGAVNVSLCYTSGPWRGGSDPGAIVGVLWDKSPVGFRHRISRCLLESSRLRFRQHCCLSTNPATRLPEHDPACSAMAGIFFARCHTAQIPRLQHGNKPPTPLQRGAVQRGTSVTRESFRNEMRSIQKKKVLEKHYAKLSEQLGEFSAR